MWLPRRAYTLLYRGSRDRMTARAFRRLCDGQGPTLVVVQCDKSWVFGGYADASWESPPPPGRVIHSADAFLFSVRGPNAAVTGPVRYPVKASHAAEALWCEAGHGPCFNKGLNVAGGRGSAFKFSSAGIVGMNSESYCNIGNGYFDTLYKGGASLTGAWCFKPVEVEVFAVTPRGESL